MNNIKLLTYLQVKLHAIDKPEIGLEIFDFKKDISELNISILAK